jgi:ABC-type nitrate/sulfonate/bicarbonate transport system permease component
VNWYRSQGLISAADGDDAEVCVTSFLQTAVYIVINTIICVRQHQGDQMKNSKMIAVESMQVMRNVHRILIGKPGA